MKAFFRGLLTAFAGFMMIATLVGSIYGLIQVWYLDGYVAVGAFLGFAVALFGDGYLLYKIGKGGAYAKDCV